jgi:hypothetical protein
MPNGQPRLRVFERGYRLRLFGTAFPMTSEAIAELIASGVDGSSGRAISDADRAMLSCLMKLIELQERQAVYLKEIVHASQGTPRRKLF